MSSENGFLKVLKKLKIKASNPREQGAYFENLIKSFLKYDPIYQDKFKDVWLWSEWPDRGNKPDTGVDIVAKSHSGETFAIQCKFYDQNHELQKGDIDSFLNELGKKCFDKGIIFSTTNHWSKHAENALINRTKSCSRIDFYQLEQSHVDWEKLSEGGVAENSHVIPQKELYPHQADALKKVLNGFLNSDVGKMIMPCGTGKTFTALKISEKITPANGTVLVLVPSLSLVSQTLREWSNQKSRPMKSFVVCSDKQVGKSEEEDIKISDLELPPTTKYLELSRELSNVMKSNKNSNTINVIFSTYQSIKVISDVQKKGGIKPFDLTICDEAHRTTGVEGNGKDSSCFIKFMIKNF